MDDRIQEVLRRFESLNTQLSDPSVLADSDRLREAARQHAELAPTAEVAAELARVRERLAEAREVAETSDDEELVELARL